MQEDIIRAESELKLISDRYAVAKSHIDELEAEKVRAKQRIAEAFATEEKADRELAVISEETDALTASLTELNEERESIDRLREESGEIQNALNLEIVAMRKEIEADNETIQECLRRKDAFSKRADRLNAEIEEIRQINAETEARITAYEEQAASLREGAVAAKESIAALTEKRASAEGESTVLRNKEREKTAEREKLGGELARLEERRDSMQRELETAQNKLYDEYQLTLREAIEMEIVLDDIPKAQRTLQETKNKIRGLGSVNVGAIEEYKEVSERYEYMSTQLGDIEKSKTELIKLIEELTGKMAERFRSSSDASTTISARPSKTFLTAVRRSSCLTILRMFLSAISTSGYSRPARTFRISTCFRAVKRVLPQSHFSLRFSRSHPHRSASLTRLKRRLTTSTFRDMQATSAI